MNALRFRLRTIMIVIVALAVLMGLIAAIPPRPRIRPFPGMVYFIYEAPYPLGAISMPFDPVSWALVIMTGRTLKLPGQPPLIELLSIPLEYVAVPLIIVVLATRLAFRWRKQAKRRRPSVSLQQPLVGPDLPKEDRARDVSSLRLRTMMIIIATLAVLMVLGAIMRSGRGPQGVYGWLEPPDSGSGPARFVTRRWEVWIRIDQTLDSRGFLKETEYVCIPVEYLATLIVILAVPVILAVDYLSRWRKQDQFRGRPDGPSTTCPFGKLHLSRGSPARDDVWGTLWKRS
jgi:hypothetical protein